MRVPNRRGTTQPSPPNHDTYKLRQKVRGVMMVTHDSGNSEKMSPAADTTILPEAVSRAAGRARG